MKAKILCIGRNPSGGGAARVQGMLLDHLQRSAFDISLFYLESVEDMPAVRVPLTNESGEKVETGRDLRLPGVIRRLCALARGCDIVFGMQDGRPLDLAVLVGQIMRRPAIGWVHNLPSRSNADFPGGHPWIARFLYPHAVRIVAVSKGVAEDLVRWSPRTAPNVVSLPNPLDVLALRRLAERPLPAWAQSVFARKTLLGMGWLIRRKGFDLLLRSFASVVRSGHDLNLLLLGEGEERASLEAQVEDLGLSGRVFLPGYHADPYPLLSRAEAFVLSSRNEGLPTVLLEAMSLGVPVVAFDCPSGPSEILDKGRYGLLVPPEDHSSMASAIGNVLSSPTLRSRCRSLGLERAMRYDARAVARQFEDLFLEALDGRGGETS